MKLTKAFLLLITVFFLFLGCQNAPRIGEQFASKEKRNDAFTIRVSAFEENRNFAQVLAGAFYVFESRPTGQKDWVKIIEIRHDDPIEINDKWMGLVNQRVGYVFMRYEFAVTTDGGRNWMTWGLDKNEQLDRPNCKIDDVSLDENGLGEMRVSCSQESVILRTSNYGTSWQ